MMEPKRDWLIHVFVIGLLIGSCLGVILSGMLSRTQEIPQKSQGGGSWKLAKTDTLNRFTLFSGPIMDSTYLQAEFYMNGLEVVFTRWVIDDMDRFVCRCGTAMKNIPGRAERTIECPQCQHGEFIIEMEKIEHDHPTTQSVQM